MGARLGQDGLGVKEKKNEKGRSVCLVVSEGCVLVLFIFIDLCPFFLFLFLFF